MLKKFVWRCDGGGRKQKEGRERKKKQAVVMTNAKKKQRRYCENGERETHSVKPGKWQQERAAAAAVVINRHLSWQMQ